MANAIASFTRSGWALAAIRSTRATCAMSMSATWKHFRRWRSSWPQARDGRVTGVRFTGPVYPGETIETAIWKQDGRLAFRSRAPACEAVVLDHGWVSHD